MSTETTTRLVGDLAGIVGAEHVITDGEEREYFSRDLSFEKAEVAEIVAQPGSTEELAAVVQVAHQAGSPVVARGGGMSYTRGFTRSWRRSRAARPRSTTSGAGSVVRWRRIPSCW